MTETLMLKTCLTCGELFEGTADATCPYYDCFSREVAPVELDTAVPTPAVKAREDRLRQCTDDHRGYTLYKTRRGYVFAYWEGGDYPGPFTLEAAEAFIVKVIMDTSTSPLEDAYDEAGNLVGWPPKKPSKH